jgi:hypothetical protein
MRLALHIFRKDVRRLWWETAVATAALAYLSHLDANRMDYMVGPVEGLLNLVVPAAWAYLIVLLVQQESLVGDRQFWLTRPYPRAALLMAKLLFVLCFVHVPSLLFDVAVVQARGFNPLAHLSSLLEKQAMLAATLTVPALGLAAVTRNSVQFATAGLICVIGGHLLTTNFAAPWIRVETIRQNGAMLIIAAGAATAVVLQYSGRRVAIARSVAVTAFSSAVLLAAYMPRQYTVAAACRGDMRISVAAAQHNGSTKDLPRYPDADFVSVALPIRVAGAPQPAILILNPLAFEIENDRGDRWAMQPVPVRSAPAPRPAVYPLVEIAEGQNDGWLMVRIDKKVFGGIAAAPVRVIGDFTATVRLRRPTAVMPVPVKSSETPIGRCANFLVENMFIPYREDLLKVVCESPDEVPRAFVEFVHLASGRRARHGLGDAGMYVSYPTASWLSPVHRRNTFFQIFDDPLPPQERQYSIARSELADGSVEIKSFRDDECDIVRIEFGSVDIGKHILENVPGRYPR